MRRAFLIILLFVAGFIAIQETSGAATDGEIGWNQCQCIYMTYPYPQAKPDSYCINNGYPKPSECSGGGGNTRPKPVGN